MRKYFSAFVILISISYAKAQENCGNGTDDDGDGFIDCQDPGCHSDVVPTGTYFNTATNKTGGILPGGSDDHNWKVSAGSLTGPYVPATVMGNIPGNYYKSPWPDCHWISHSATGTHSIDIEYYYKISFDLPCENSCGSSYADSNVFCLFMDFLADNSVDEVYINGVPQSASLEGIPSANPYYHQGYSAANMLSLSLCKGWKPGTNELILKITSGPGYAGFLAQNSTKTTNNTADPTISLPAGADNIFCITEAPVKLSGASPGGKWSATCGTCIDPVTGIFDPAKASPGKHIITYEVMPTCPITDTIGIEITEPAVTIVPVVPLCKNHAPFEMKASTPGGKWSGTGITDAQNGMFDPSLLTPGVHQVKYEITGICAAADSVNITIKEVTVDAVASDNDTICPGEIASLSVQGGPPYLWNTGDTNASIQVNPDTTTLYTVRVTNDTCASDPDSAYVIVLSPPLAAFTPDVTAGLSPFLVKFDNNSIGAITYHWDFGDGNTSSLHSPQHTFLDTGYYIVKLIATNRHGCADTAAYRFIRVIPEYYIHVPNAFTPNFDNINDQFMGQFDGLEWIDGFIFDRWGELLHTFSMNDPYWWDGNFKGIPCQDGVYYCVIHYATLLQKRKYNYKGWIRLLK